MTELQASRNGTIANACAQLGFDEAGFDLESISAASRKLDLALGDGGFPKGQIVDLYGAESSDRATLTLLAIAAAQRTGGICAFIGVGQGVDPAEARRFGVDLDELLVSKSVSDFHALEIADTLVRSGIVDFLVIDMPAGMASPNDRDGTARESRVEAPTGALGPTISRLTNALARSNCLLMRIDQPRMPGQDIFPVGRQTATDGVEGHASIHFDIARIGARQDRDQQVEIRRPSRREAPDGRTDGPGIPSAKPTPGTVIPLAVRQMPPSTAPTRGQATGNLRRGIQPGARNSKATIRQRAMEAPLLSRERELELASLWLEHRDIAARAELVQAHERLVVTFAKKFERQNLSFIDLFQEGMVALLFACDKYDPSTGHRFATYAQWWLLSFLQDLSRADAVVRVGKSRKEKAIVAALAQARRRFGQELSPAIKERIAIAKNATAEEVWAIDAITGVSILSLNQTIGPENDGAEFIERLVDDTQGAESAARGHLDDTHKRIVGEIMKDLDEREKIIITERFLIDDDERRTLRDLAATLDISPERVRQVEKEALRRLRQALDLNRIVPEDVRTW